jgi:hypothetical protein
MCICLLFLCGCCAFETDTVPDVATGEVAKLAAGQGPEGTADGRVAKMLLLHL